MCKIWAVVGEATVGTGKSVECGTCPVRAHIVHAHQGIVGIGNSTRTSRRRFSCNSSSRSESEESGQDRFSFGSLVEDRQICIPEFYTEQVEMRALKLHETEGREFEDRKDRLHHGAGNVATRLTVCKRKREGRYKRRQSAWQ